MMKRSAFKVSIGAVFLMVVAAAIISCGGGGGGNGGGDNGDGLPPVKPWTGIKQAGAAGADTRGRGIAVDSNGNVFVVGYTDGGLDGNALSGTIDFFLTKYDRSGNRIYTRQTGTASATTRALDLAVDSNGNVYVAGYTDGGLDGNTLAGSYDLFLTKYDGSGNKLYTRQTGTAGAITNAHSVAVDSRGNVFVAGITSGNLSGDLSGIYDAFLIKYDASGNKLDTKQTGTAGMMATATGVVVDSSGNVYVAGHTTGGLDGNIHTVTRDFFLMKYAPSGIREYIKQMGTVGKRAFANDVAVDSSQNVYVVGMTDGDLGGETLAGIEDSFLTKYDPSGNMLYTRLTGTIGAETAAMSVAVDSGGNVYVAGMTNGGLDGNSLNGNLDLFMTKYDPSGTKAYTIQMAGPGTVTYAEGIVVDANDDIFMTGATSGGLGENIITGIFDFFVSKFNPDGNTE